MSLEIIGAGFGRTGTHSLKLALDQLGYAPCHHMYEVRSSASQTAQWLKIAHGDRPDWREVFASYTAQVDWPGSVFWRELVEAFPEAKVILTGRDPEGWYASMLETIVPAAIEGRYADPDPMQRQGSEIIYELVLKRLFGGRFHDRAHALDVFSRHLDAVVATVPASRLLVYDTRDGWGPLCDFLGLPVPQEPYPKGNTVGDFRARKPYLSKPAATGATAHSEREGQG